MGTIVARGEAKWSLPVPMPREGVLVAMGSFISPGAGYTLVDFDRHSITRFGTIMDTLPDGEIETPLTSRISRPLSAEEQDDLVAAANTVWNPPAGTRRGSPRVTDSACTITLFDKDDMLNEFGMACPYDTDQLVETLGEIKTPRP